MRVAGIDLDGRWTKRQLVRVLEIVNDASYPWRRFYALDITCHKDSVRWFLIVEDHQWWEFTRREPLRTTSDGFLKMESN